MCNLKILARKGDNSNVRIKPISESDYKKLESHQESDYCVNPTEIYLDYRILKSQVDELALI